MAFDNNFKFFIWIYYSNGSSIIISYKFINIRFSKYLRALSTIKENDVASAAPVRPYSGIRMELEIIFKTNAIDTFKRLNLVYPLIVKVDDPSPKIV